MLHELNQMFNWAFVQPARSPVEVLLSMGKSRSAIYFKYMVVSETHTVTGHKCGAHDQGVQIEAVETRITNSRKFLEFA